MVAISIILESNRGCAELRTTKVIGAGNDFLLRTQSNIALGAKERQTELFALLKAPRDAHRVAMRFHSVADLLRITAAHRRHSRNASRTASANHKFIPSL